MNQSVQVSCAVCEEKRDEKTNVGWHCGAITCEACKKFFLRGIKSGDPLKLECARNTKDCVITRLTRASCIYCRFMKCLSVGMVVPDQSKNKPARNIIKEINCAVCAHRASGLHFGAVTCDGCKSFFGRTQDLVFLKECSGNNVNPCDVTNQCRKACRFCRYKKCIAIGMSKENIKPGRQSNLFKQQLIKSQLATGSPTLIDSTAYSRIDLVNLENDNFQSYTINTFYTDDSFMRITDILSNEAYTLISNLTQGYKVLDAIPYFDVNSVDENRIAIELLRIHTEKCVLFISALPYYNSFTTEEKEKFIKNAIHPIRLLQIARLAIQSNQRLNYFNCDEDIFAKICCYFPIFKRISPFFQELVDTMQEMKLDATELILYTAFLAFSAAGCTSSTNQRSGYLAKQLVFRTLGEYMQMRRSESDSCEQLIGLSYRFEKINLFLCNGIRK